MRAANKDVVFAVGRLHTDAKVDSLSRVPGEVSFTIDLRSQDTSVLLELNVLLDKLAAEVGTRRAVRFEISERAVAEPTIMDQAFRAALCEGALACGIVAPELPCGAGHDTAEFVRAGIPSCMVFVRNSGESHNPDEHMDFADFRNGVLLLTWFLTRMAC